MNGFFLSVSTLFYNTNAHMYGTVETLFKKTETLTVHKIKNQNKSVHIKRHHKKLY